MMINYFINLLPRTFILLVYMRREVEIWTWWALSATESSCSSWTKILLSYAPLSISMTRRDVERQQVLVYFEFCIVQVEDSSWLYINIWFGVMDLKFCHIVIWWQDKRCLHNSHMPTWNQRWRSFSYFRDVGDCVRIGMICTMVFVFEWMNGRLAWSQSISMEVEGEYDYVAGLIFGASPRSFYW